MKELSDKAKEDIDQALLLESMKNAAVVAVKLTGAVAAIKQTAQMLGTDEKSVNQVIEIITAKILAGEL